MAKTKYTAEIELDSIYAGDSLPQWAIKVMEVDETSGNMLVPSEVCCMIRSYGGKVIHQYTPEIKVNGKVLFKRVDGDITKDWPSGLARWDIEYTMPNGRMRTYLRGTLRIYGGVSEC